MRTQWRFVETQLIFTSISVSNSNCIYSLMNSIQNKGITKLKLLSEDLLFACRAYAVFCDFFLKDHLFQLESHKFERGRGRCPFDPSSSFTSILIGNDLYVTTFTILSIIHSESLSSAHWRCCQSFIVNFHMSYLILILIYSH